MFHDVKIFYQSLINHKYFFSFYMNFFYKKIVLYRLKIIVNKKLDCFVLQYTSKLVVKTTSMEVKRKNRLRNDVA